MATQSFLVKLKKLTKKKHQQFSYEQTEFANCVNHGVERIQKGEKLSYKDVGFNLKSAIKNEAIRREKKLSRITTKDWLKPFPHSEIQLELK